MMLNGSKAKGRTVQISEDLPSSPNEEKKEPLKICFNVCRKELYHPNKGFKQLARKLRQTATVEVNKEDVTLERLLPYDVVVFAAPQDKLSDEDVATIREYVEKGGAAVLLFTEGHNGQYSYLNKALDEWTGITLNEDCVVRTVMHKYLHPKEVCVTNGVTNRAINKAAGKNVVGGSGRPDGSARATTSGFGGTASSFGRTAATLNRTVAPGTVNPNTMMQMMQQQADDRPEEPSSLVFVYPYGLTFNVQRPAIPILSSGFMAYPLNRPIAAVWESPNVVEHLGRRKQGRLLTVGSAQLFDDTWLNKEENDTLTTVLIDYLSQRVRLNQIDAEEPDITDYHHLPDTASLADHLRVAVEQQEELPRDFTKLFELETFKLDTDHIPDVMDAYEKINVKLEPLTLIPPEFQTPLPPVKPAVFGPIHRDPMCPALDLFDLDEEFAPEKVRLSQLTNKCKPEDVEFYIVQAAEIMGVTKKLRSPRNRDPRALLDYVFRQVVQYRKVNADPTAGARGSAASAGRPAENADSNAAAAAAAESMIRVIRVSTLDNMKCDTTPFDENPRWVLNLEANFSTGSIEGSIQLHDSSSRFPSQEARIQGEIKPPGEQEYPMEWAVVLEDNTGNTAFFLFLAMLQGNQLRGVCEQGSGGGNTRNFLYNIEEL